MGSVNASALTALQSRMNTERTRRGLSAVSFTGGVAAGSPIQAVHFNELRNTTESLDTLSSQTFNWTGTVAAGASITDVLPQIDSYLTTLENEALVSWKQLSSFQYITTTASGGGKAWLYNIPAAARGGGAVRWKWTNPTSTPPVAAFGLIEKTVYSPTETMPGLLPPDWPTHRSSAFSNTSGTGMDYVNTSASPSRGVNAFVHPAASAKDQLGMDDTPYTQSPSQLDTKGENSGNGSWNDTIGCVYSYDPNGSYGSYVASGNYYYTLTSPFTGSFVNLVVAASKCDSYSPNIVIEAYY